MNAEREFKPSASSGEIWYNCSVSRRRWALAPPEMPTVEASQGTEIHDAMKLEDFTGLDEQGRTIAEKLSEQKAKALDEWQKAFDEPSAGLDIIKERRLWIKHPALAPDQANACSAQVDFAAIGKKAALVLNHKTGYLRVTEAFRNIQARIEALSVFHNFPVMSVRAGFSGYRFKGYIDTVDYDTPTLGDSERELFFNLWRTEQPHASASPGPWCRHCPARPTCPEHASHATLTLVHTGPDPMKKPDVIARVDELTPAQLAFVRERSPMMRNFLDAVDDRMKRLPPEELASVGWQIVPGGNVRVIPSIEKLWGEIWSQTTGPNPIEFSMAEFQTCLKATVTAIEEKLVDKIQARDGGTKKDALVKAKKLMEPAVTLVPKNPMLKPLKGDKALPEGE